MHSATRENETHSFRSSCFQGAVGLIADYIAGKKVVLERLKTEELIQLFESSAFLQIEALQQSCQDGLLLRLKQGLVAAQDLPFEMVLLHNSQILRKPPTSVGGSSVPFVRGSKPLTNIPPTLVGGSRELLKKFSRTDY